MRKNSNGVAFLFNKWYDYDNQQINVVTIIDGGENEKEILFDT